MLREDALHGTVTTDEVLREVPCRQHAVTEVVGDGLVQRMAVGGVYDALFGRQRERDTKVLQASARRGVWGW